MSQDSGASRAGQVLQSAIDGRLFPAAVAEVGDRRQVLWRHAAGRFTFESDARSADEDTVFDLASLTKPLATTSLVMDLAAAGVLDLGLRLADAFNEWRGADREAASVRDLLEHASGLPARLVDAPPQSRREFQHEICRIRLECSPHGRSIYSDLGFILLGFLVEDRGTTPLAEQFAACAARILSEYPDQRVAGAHAVIDFSLPAESARNTAPTKPLDEDSRRGRLLTGEVHDNYAHALGGVAGHAGLFGNVAGVAAFARAVLRGRLGGERGQGAFAPRWVIESVTKSTVPGSSRALGWDTMLPTSSCGTRMSSSAFGHVGFTGTSLWIDPDQDRYFVLLTNRACGGGGLDEMRVVRQRFHDAAVDI